ncbi:Protein FAR1-RELATED SEQUENCE 5 [Linum perenne]
MPANRNVGEADKDTLRHYRETGLRPSEAYDLEVHHSGGHANVGYTKRDAFNHCHRDDIEKLSEGDAATTLAYLKSKTNGDIDFFMKYTVVEDRMLEKHEKEDNYTWALDTLTKAMGGKNPTSVITDGDHAMSIAITKVFPKATHRLCSWHLDKNVAQHVKDTQFKSGWSKFVDAEYEDNEFVEKCSLQTNNWVKHLFDKRHEWAQTYRSVFFAGMKTTPRCEGLNSKLGKYVGHNYSILEFCVNFDRWMEDMRDEEQRLDYESIHRAPELTSKTMRSVEKSASDVYTLKAFDKFKHELEKSSIWSKESEETIGDYHIYILKKYDPNNSTRDKVIYDVEKKSAECTCKAFNSLGIPCQHMIAILKEEAIFEIPDSFVIRRFTKKPKNKK